MFAFEIFRIVKTENRAQTSARRLERLGMIREVDRENTNLTHNLTLSNLNLLDLVYL